MSDTGWHPDPQKGEDYKQLLEDELDACKVEIARLRRDLAGCARERTALCKYVVTLEDVRNALLDDRDRWRAGQEVINRRARAAAGESTS